MAVEETEVRVTALEAEVARLKQRLSESTERNGHWVDRVYGTFDGDPDSLEAMRLGRKYSQSRRPKPAKPPTKQRKR